MSYPNHSDRADEKAKLKCKNCGHGLCPCGDHYHHVGNGCGECHPMFPDTCKCRNPEPEAV